MTTTDTRFPIKVAYFLNPDVDALGRRIPARCDACGDVIFYRQRVWIVDPEGWHNRHCSKGCAEYDQETLRRINPTEETA